MDCGFQSNAFQDDAFQVCIPVPPAPVIRVEPRRWAGPSILLYDDNDTYWKRQRREEEEILILK